jgi:hypothetical protein
MPRPVADRVFAETLERLELDNLLKLVDAAQRRPGHLGIQPTDDVPPGVPRFDPEEPRFRNWPELDELFVRDAVGLPGPTDPHEQRVARHRPRRMPSFHPDGRRCLVVADNTVWSVDVVDRTLLPLCHGHQSDTGRLRSAVWLDPTHFAVAADAELRVMRLQGADAVVVCELRRKGVGNLTALCGGRLLHSATDDRTLLIRWSGALDVVGFVGAELQFAGERDGQVYLRHGGQALTLSRLEQVLGSSTAASDAPEGPRLGEQVPSPASTPGLRAKAGSRALSAPATRGVHCEG